MDIIPIIGIIFLFGGLFTTISLAFYFRYKTKASASQNNPGEMTPELIRARSEAATKVGRAGLLRMGGGLVGSGLGSLIGCLIVANNSAYNDNIAALVVISLAILCGGAGMIGAYFLERRLDNKTK